MFKFIKVFIRSYIIAFTTLLPLLTINKNLFGNDKLIPIQYKKTILDNGLRVIMVEHHEFPVVAVELLVKAGSVHDSQGKEGLANIVAQLLREGTHGKESLEIAEEIDFIGGTLNVDGDYDSTSVTATALAKHFPLILNLISEVTRFPSFQPKELEFHREKTVASILREKDNKTSIANRNFSEMLYGIHPYAHPPIGTVEGLKSITRNEIVEFHRNHFLPNNAILTVVGDINTSGIVAAVKETFGIWKKGKITEAQLPPVPRIDGYTIRIIDKPDLTQTEIQVGHPGINRTDPDYFSTLLFNYILGKGPTSRLYTTLRAEKGLTYSATSLFDARNFQGPFLIRTYSKNESAIHTLRLVLDELQKITSKGITNEELDSAKSYYVGHFPLSIETSSQIASRIIEQEFYGLPEDYLEKYLVNIQAVSIEDVNRTIKRVLDPKNLVIVLVSKAEDILEDAKALGEVEVREP